MVQDALIPHALGERATVERESESSASSASRKLA
jgi:hypothetical protein